MYPMSGPPNTAQPVTFEYQFQPVQASAAFLYWVAILGCFVYIFMRHMASEELQLRMVHTLMRGLQATAAFFGAWALDTEQFYNEIVSTLH